MRTLRVSLVPVVIVVLLGALSGAVVAQSGGGVYVTGTTWCIDEPRTIQVDDGVELHLFPLRCTATMNDPRLSGTGVMDMQQFCLTEAGGHVCMGEGRFELTGPGGTWVGTYGWVQAASRVDIPGWGILEGTGSYEGWTSWFHVPDLMDPAALYASILYEGPPPPPNPFTNRVLFDAPVAALSRDHRCLRYDHRGQGIAGSELASPHRTSWGPRGSTRTRLRSWTSWASTASTGSGRRAAGWSASEWRLATRSWSAHWSCLGSARDARTWGRSTS